MKNKNLIKGVSLIFLEILFLAILFSSAPQEVVASIGNPTESQTNLTIANSYPEVHNISINDNDPIALTPNATTLVGCSAVIIDWNGDSDIQVANATFYKSTTPQSNSDDNNNHYTNSSCTIDKTYGTLESAMANCTFQVQYYADPGNWNCTIQVNDTANSIGTGTKQGIISELLALGLPDIINYGIINATSISSEQQINITNYGNIKINLSLEGYGYSLNDGNAMNCSLGTTKNISINLEKFNLTSSIPGVLNLTQFQSNYTNLTTNPIVKQFNLTSRIDDSSEDTTKPTYWRIYVPTGVAGTCTGNIIFGATTAGEN